MALDGGWPVGKKPVIRLLGLNGGGANGVGFLGGSVDSEKVGGEGDVVGGRHCARVCVWVGLVVGGIDKMSMLVLEVE